MIKLFCSSILFFSLVTVAAAQQVMIDLRVLEGRGVLEAQLNSSHTLSELDPELEDLRNKLQKLHFKTFKLLDQRQEIVPIMKKTKIQLGIGHELHVRPLYSQSGKIGVWLKWLDRDGTELLDTRLHFEPGSSVLTGTMLPTKKIIDGEQRAVILAIQVKDTE